ncbi:putative lipid II flippase FtsW [Nitrococcus mobilis]|uniref:Probable peptidoglycan glycosyltransferase FtsW n=1 Tax=Nitrococcus mobilis Nb-231 TaxID=314278 RepID=A4BQI7_9GAMM|nr:putative lipid II flippase FtsW [Nitrococcus mobilis]EAR21837.1 Cell cycle protein, FtsW [Nitrococcus mobilis Nb-231]
MAETAANTVLRSARPRRREPALTANLDWTLCGVVLAVAALGLVMVASASVAVADRELGQPWFYLRRQGGYLLLAALLAWFVLRVPMIQWQRLGVVLLALGIGLLALVLLPGVGHSVNGSVRWLALGVFNLQVSELAKLCVFVYLAGYLVRRGEAVRATLRGLLIPFGVLALISLLLLLEPDFGAAVVLMATGLALLFIAGVSLWHFGLLLIPVAATGVALIVTEPYRWQRLTGFLNPWADPFHSGFQLTQSLIAIGRGQWLGVGLGNSVEKLFYLPEAHTDFLFAVLAEELGLLGVSVTIGLYGFVVWRAFRIATRAMALERRFGGYLAYAVGTWLGLQAFLNIGVNMGLLPTKGMTLPLMSYGGSSLVISVLLLTLLVRVDYENRVAAVSARTVAREHGL